LTSSNSAKAILEAFIFMLKYVVRGLGLIICVAVLLFFYWQQSEPPVAQLPLTPREVTTEEEFRPAKYQDRPPWRYRLYTPPHVEPGRKYPLILWLHGQGDSGADNWRQLLHMETTVLTPEKCTNGCDFFIIVPQKTRAMNWFGSPAYGSIGDESPPETDMLGIVSELLDKTIADLPIDESRVSIIGMSSGGAAAWEMAERHPNKFAAILPFAAAPSSDVELIRLVDIPIWVFHSPIDRVASPEPGRQTIEHLQSIGGKAAFTLSADHPETKSYSRTHFSWASAFKEYDLYDWLLAQSRESTHSPPPGRVPLRIRLLQIAAIVVGALVVYACVREYNKQRNRTGSLNITPEKGASHEDGDDNGNREDRSRSPNAGLTDAPRAIND
jgi:poly(3-hydroxybutyrate) depolymerase